MFGWNGEKTERETLDWEARGSEQSKAWATMIREHADDKSINRNMQQEVQRLFPFIWCKRMVEFCSSNECFIMWTVTKEGFFPIWPHWHKVLVLDFYFDHIKCIYMKCHKATFLNPWGFFSCWNCHEKSSFSFVWWTCLLLSLGTSQTFLAPADQKAPVHFSLGLQPNICRCLHARGSVSILK